MLAILLPITLPTAMPGEPTRAACRLVMSSGVDVPNPTRVKPIKSGDTPKRRARATLPRTSSSPPLISRTRPTLMCRTSIRRTLHVPGDRMAAR